VKTIQNNFPLLRKRLFRSLRTKELSWNLNRELYNFRGELQQHAGFWKAAWEKVWAAKTQRTIKRRHGKNGAEYWPAKCLTEPGRQLLGTMRWGKTRRVGRLEGGFKIGFWKRVQGLSNIEHGYCGGQERERKASLWGKHGPNENFRFLDSNNWEKKSTVKLRALGFGLKKFQRLEEKLQRKGGGKRGEGEGVTGNIKNPYTTG